MAGRSIDINIRSRISGSAGAVRGRGATDAGRSASERAQEMRTEIGRKKSPQEQSTVQLARDIRSLKDSMLKLRGSVERLQSTMAGQKFRPGSGGGGDSGPGVRAGRGGGMGAMGTAMGIIGVPVAALSFALSKIVQIGQAHVAKAMEQYGTAGVGGFQRSGKFLGSFSATEYSAYQKEKRMAAGRIDLGENEYATELVTTGRGRNAKTSKRTVEPLGVKVGSMFGMGTELGKMAGLSRAMNPREVSGESFVDSLIEKIVSGQRGLTTELPFIMKEISTSMEDAVREGVSTSGLAGDIADQMTRMGRASLTGQARSASRTVKNLTDIQEQVGKRQGAGVAQWQMRLAGRDVIQGKGPQSQAAQKLLTESGLFGKDTDWSKITPEQMMMGVEYLNQSKFGGIREKYMERVVPTLSGKGGSQQERFAVFNKLSRDAGLAQDTTQARDMFVDYERKQAPEKLDKLRKEQADLEQRSKAATTREEGMKNKGFFDDPLSFITKPFRESTDDINKRLKSVDREMKDKRMSGVSLEEEAAEEMRIRKGDKTPGIPTAKEAVNKSFKETGFDVVRGRKAQQGRKEEMVLGSAGAMAADATQKVELAFIRMAQTLSNPKTGLPLDSALNVLTESITVLAKGSTEAIQMIVKSVNTLKGMSAKEMGSKALDFFKKGGITGAAVDAVIDNIKHTQKGGKGSLF